MHRLIIDDYPLLIIPSLAEVVGLNEAIILQQIHFWTSKKKHHNDGRYWVYNSYDGWAEQFPFWSKSTIVRILRRLEDRGLIIVGNYNRLKIDQTKWYAINYDKLNELVKVSSPLSQNE